MSTIQYEKRPYFSNSTRYISYKALRAIMTYLVNMPYTEPTEEEKRAIEEKYDKYTKNVLSRMEKRRLEDEQELAMMSPRQRAQQAKIIKEIRDKIDKKNQKIYGDLQKDLAKVHILLRDGVLDDLIKVHFRDNGKSEISIETLKTKAPWVVSDGIYDNFIRPQENSSWQDVNTDIHVLKSDAEQYTKIINQRRRYRWLNRFRQIPMISVLKLDEFTFVIMTDQYGKKTRIALIEEIDDAREWRFVKELLCEELPILSK